MRVGAKHKLSGGRVVSEKRSLQAILKPCNNLQKNECLDNLFLLSTRLSTLCMPLWRAKEVHHHVGSNMGGQFVYDSELAIGIADEQRLHQIILGSLKIAYFVYSSQFFFGKTAAPL